MPPSSSDDRSVKLLAVTWVFCGLGITLVTLRLYSRATISRQFFLDDLWIALSLMCDIGMCIVRTLYAAKGYAKHRYMLPLDDIKDAQRLTWISIGMSLAAPNFGRLSVAALIHRIGPRRKWPSRILKAFMVMLGLTFVGSILLTYLQCSPPGALFDPELRRSSSTKCLETRTYAHAIIGFASFWCFSDVALAVIAISMFWNLKDALRKRALLLVLLLFGVFAGVCIAVKIYYCILITNTDDFTWLNAAVFLWDTIEANIIIVAACMATLGPFTLKLLCREERLPPVHKSESRLSSVFTMFGTFKSKKSVDSDANLEAYEIGPILAPDSMYSLGSESRQPNANGVSTAYSSGDLPSLSDAAIRVQEQLAIDSAEQDQTHRFQEEGYR